MPGRQTHPAALFLALALLAGCSVVAAPAGGAETDAGASTDVASAADAAASPTMLDLAASHDDEADYAWDESTEVAVSLADGASSGGDGVSIDGDVVMITRPGNYRLSGSLSDGQLVVDTTADGIVRLILDGVDIVSSTTSPISVANAEKVVVILADGSQNSLTDPATYRFISADVDEPNAALFSAADLTIVGDGSITVSGNFNDGIASKDGLIIAGGTITVDAVDDGIRGKDYLIVKDGDLTVTAGGDALKVDNEEDAVLGYVAIADGTLDLTAGTDAIDAITGALVGGGTLTIAADDDAIHSDVGLEISGGSIDITRSYEGLEATQIVISGGDIDLVSEDDGLNVAGGNDASAAAGPDGFDVPGGGPGDFGGPGGGGPGGETAVEGYYVEMSGGTLVIDAGGDGFDSNGSATVTGGTIVVSGPTERMNGALDVNGEFLISNAILLAAGSVGMAETPSASSAQATLNVVFDTVQPTGTIVRIQAPDGSELATFEASKEFQSLVFSSPDVASGTAYEVLTGGSVSGDNTGGLYLDPDYVPGTSVGTVSAGN
jgi:hypothetical protein